MKKQKIITALLSLAICCSPLFHQYIYADGNSSVQQYQASESKILYIEDGAITLGYENNRIIYTQGETTEECDTLILKNNDMTTASANNIIINTMENTTIDIIVEDINISATAAMKITGNGTVNIELEGTSKFQSGNANAGIEVGVDSTLCINDIDDDGYLYAYGSGSWNSGAGIGSSYDNNCGTIIINNGSITAKGGWWSACIGGGKNGGAGLIIINGGNITAHSDWYGCGIGSGNNNDKGGRVIINGGNISACSNVHGAGIGGAYSSFIDEVIINGGTIISQGRGWESGMGDGSGKSKSIVILNGDVTVSGGEEDIGFANGAININSITGRNADGSFTSSNHIHIFDMILSDTPATYDSPRLIGFYCLDETCPQYDELIQYPIGSKLDAQFPPVITGLQDNYVLNLGDTLTLEGTITANNNGVLKVVNLRHNDENTTFEQRRVELNGTSSTFELADFGIFTTENYPLNTLGTHEFIIFASADNYTVTQNEIASFTITVEEKMPDVLNMAVECNNPEDYAGNYRGFSVVFNTYPTSAYLQFDNQHDASQWLDDTYCSSNVLFNINPDEIEEMDGQYIYNTEFRIHSEGLASENYMRKVRVVANYAGEKTVSEAHSFQVKPIPERETGNTIGYQYEQTSSPDENVDKPEIIHVTNTAGNEIDRVLTIIDYDCDASASPFFWWETDCGTFYEIADDFTKVGFIPNGSGTVTVYMGDGLGYVTSYELTIEN